MAKSEEVTEKNHDIKLIIKNKNPKRGFARFKERLNDTKYNKKTWDEIKDNLKRIKLRNTSDI